MTMTGKNIWGTWLLSAAALLVTMAVSVEGQRQDPAANAGAALGSNGDITFHRDVLPILQDNCQSCHRPGQIGPFSLLDYRGTRPWARAIRDRVIKREMPPWFADPHYGKFANDTSLSQQEIDTIVRWVDAGAPEGNPTDAPPPVEWPEGGWQIKPDFVVKGPEYLVPKTGILDWQYMVVPTGFTEDTWVSSMEMRPGSDPRVTHHYCVFVVPKMANVKYGELVSLRDLGVGGEGRDGCYEPGQGPFDYRKQQAGRLIPANSDIIFEMHYNPRGQEVLDQPQIGFTVLEQAPKRKFVFQNVGNGARINIAPHQADYKAPVQEGVLTEDSEIVWMQGHAHYRAKEMRFTITYPDGRSEVALHVRWNPNWQQVYYPEKPIIAPKGTLLTIEGWYDNSSRNPFNPDPAAPVPFGLGAAEEMLFPTFGFVVDASVETKQIAKPSPRADRTFTVRTESVGETNQ